MTATPGQSPRKLRRGDTVELSIDSLTMQGLGEGRIGDPHAAAPYVVHIPRVVPGERVRAEVISRRGKTITALPKELLSASPARCEPRCCHFEPPPDAHSGYAFRCGGCSLQMLPYEEQLVLKSQRIEKLLDAVGIDTSKVAPIIDPDDPWHYRNKMEFTFGLLPDGKASLGLHPTGMSWRVFELRECFLLSPFVASLVEGIADWANTRGLPAYRHREDSGFLRTLTVREGKRTGERLIDLTTKPATTVQTLAGNQPTSEIVDQFATMAENLAQAHGETLTSIVWTEHQAVRGKPTRFVESAVRGSPVLHEQLHLADGQQLCFEIHPRAFFQPNTLQAERLYDEIHRAAGLGNQDHKPTALDLYCGTGSIALTLARHCTRVIGIELDANAVDNARRNALFNDIDNITFYAGDVGKVLAAEIHPAGIEIDLVVVDPPRSGLMPAALEKIQAIGAPALVYVSCNPEALARDIVQLARFGFELDAIQPVDMFPQTAHVECVARLHRCLASAPSG